MVDIINKTFKTSIDTRVTDLILRYEEPTTISEDPVAAFQVGERRFGAKLYHLISHTVKSLKSAIKAGLRLVFKMMLGSLSSIEGAIQPASF